MLTGNSIGRRLVLTSFGESHGKCIGTILDGCPAGLDLTEKDIILSSISNNEYLEIGHSQLIKILH